MACSNPAAVCSWPAKFYDVSSHKWVLGQFCLADTAVYFYSGDCDTLYLEFTDILCINKALSSFMFPSITVSTKSGKIFWFSSFRNRNSTFLTIQHFVQGSVYMQHDSRELFSSPSLVGPEQRSKLRTDYLRILHDSQATLQKAAVNLAEQGEQLNNASFTMDDLHEDLSVAERISSGLNSWLGRWRAPPTVKTEELILVGDNDIPDVLDLDVLCTPSTSGNIGTQMQCVFRVAPSGISILDLKQKITYHSEWSGVSRIRVVTPWEIIVTKYLIGQPDVSYNIMSIHMPVLLKKLEMFACSKMEYMNPPEAHHQRHTQHTLTSLAHRSGQMTFHPDSSSGMIESSPGAVTQWDQLALDGPQLSQASVEQQDAITDSEVAELSSLLSNLKNLAEDIQVEQDSQMGTINRLTDSVTVGSDRLKKLNSTINKLAT